MTFKESSGESEDWSYGTWLPAPGAENIGGLSQRLESVKALLMLIGVLYYLIGEKGEMMKRLYYCPYLFDIGQRQLTKGQHLVSTAAYDILATVQYIAEHEEHKQTTCLAAVLELDTHSDCKYSMLCHGPSLYQRHCSIRDESVHIYRRFQCSSVRNTLFLLYQSKPIVMLSMG